MASIFFMLKLAMFYILPAVHVAIEGSLVHVDDEIFAKVPALEVMIGLSKMFQGGDLFLPTFLRRR